MKELGVYLFEFYKKTILQENIKSMWFHHSLGKLLQTSFICGVRHGFKREYVYLLILERSHLRLNTKYSCDTERLKEVMFHSLFIEIILFLTADPAPCVALFTLLENQ